MTQPPPESRRDECLSLLSRSYCQGGQLLLRRGRGDVWYTRFASSYHVGGNFVRRPNRKRSTDERDVLAAQHADLEATRRDRRPLWSAAFGEEGPLRRASTGTSGGGRPSLAALEHYAADISATLPAIPRLAAGIPPRSCYRTALRRWGLPPPSRRARTSRRPWASKGCRSGLWWCGGNRATSCLPSLVPSTKPFHVSTLQLGGVRG